jgi:uncharacterized protein
MTTDWLKELEDRVRKEFEKHSVDHDFDHIARVTALAKYIAGEEGADIGLVTAAALLHDISDHKLNGGKLYENAKVARQYVIDAGMPVEFADKVAEIVDGVSFKGSGVEDRNGSLELDVVRDADRLDAMGAIGIARAFHFGGSRNRPFFTHGQAPKEHTSFEEYAADKSHTINHFHEKLLLLKDRLKTPVGKRLGEKRHRLMQDFVNGFYEEWNFNQHKH